MTDVLTAIDDALDTGVAADDDPLTRELQELALVLRDDAPEPTPEFRERLDWQVESGFKKPRGSRRAWWQPLLQPAAALGLTAAAVLVVALAAGGLSGSNNDDGGGGSGAQGALATDDSGGGGRGAGESDSRGTAEPALSAPKQSARSAGGADQSAATVLPPSGGGFAPGRSDRKIERSVALELETPVDEMARVADQVTAVTNRYGGFVLNSSLSTGDDGAGGDFDLRIPANRLRSAVRDLSALADVRTQSQTGPRRDARARDRQGPPAGRARRAAQPAAAAGGRDDGRGGGGDPPQTRPRGWRDQRPPRPAARPAPADRLLRRHGDPGRQGRGQRRGREAARSTTRWATPAACLWPSPAGSSEGSRWRCRWRCWRSPGGPWAAWSGAGSASPRWPDEGGAASVARSLSS